MKSLSRVLGILAVVVKWSGVAMVAIESIQFFNTKLKHELAKIDGEETNQKDESNEVISE